MAQNLDVPDEALAGLTGDGQSHLSYSHSEKRQAWGSVRFWVMQGHQDKAQSGRSMGCGHTTLWAPSGAAMLVYLVPLPREAGVSTLQRTPLHLAARE